MKTINKYQNEQDEFLHPLWLGILILFTVMIVVGMLCCLRKKYGLQLRHLFNRLCCRNESRKEHDSKVNKHVPITGPYNWTPAYIPAPSLSPKYALVRNIQMSSLDKESSVQYSDSKEDEIENDLCSIAESDHAINLPRKLTQPNSEQELNKNRTREAARRFYASMRRTSQCQNSLSIDSYNNEPSSATVSRLNKSNQDIKLKLFRTTRFFQSITNRG